MYDPHPKEVMILTCHFDDSPFAGNGANLALMDGWDFAVCLISQASLKLAISEYDKLSMPRAISTVKYSHYTIDGAHARGIKLLLYKLMVKMLGFLVGR